MKTIINNLDTALTIDTYQMFNGESAYEMELDYYKTEENKEVDINYNHKQIVKDLAEASINEIMIQLDKYENTTGIINHMTVVKTYSPQFYNYTTDSYNVEIDFNEDKLEKFIKDNYDDFQQFDDNSIENQLIFLLDQIDKDSYNQGMWERETEIYINNQTVTEIN